MSRVNEITAEELSMLLDNNTGKLAVIDVRDDDFNTEGGHIR